MHHDESQKRWTCAGSDGEGCPVTADDMDVFHDRAPDVIITRTVI